MLENTISDRQHSVFHTVCLEKLRRLCGKTAVLYKSRRPTDKLNFKCCKQFWLRGENNVAICKQRPNLASGCIGHVTCAVRLMPNTKAKFTISRKGSAANLDAADPQEFPGRRGPQPPVDNTQQAVGRRKRHASVPRGSCVSRKGRRTASLPRERTSSARGARLPIEALAAFSRETHSFPTRLGAAQRSLVVLTIP